MAKLPFVHVRQLAHIKGRLWDFAVWRLRACDTVRPLLRPDPCTPIVRSANPDNVGVPTKLRSSPT